MSYPLSSQSLFGGSSQSQSQEEFSLSQGQSAGSQLTQLAGAYNEESALLSGRRLLRHISGSSLISSKSQSQGEKTTDSQLMSQPLTMDIQKLAPPVSHKTTSGQYRTLDTDVIFDPVRKFFKTYKEQAPLETKTGTEFRGSQGDGGRPRSVIDSVSEFTKMLNKLQLDIDKFSNIDEFKAAIDKLLDITQSNPTQQDVMTKLDEMSEQMILHSKMIQMVLEEPSLQTTKCQPPKVTESRSCQTSPVAAIKPTPRPDLQTQVANSTDQRAKDDMSIAPQKALKRGGDRERPTRSLNRKISTVKPDRKLSQPDFLNEASMTTQQFAAHLTEATPAMSASEKTTETPSSGVTSEHSTLTSSGVVCSKQTTPDEDTTISPASDVPSSTVTSDIRSQPDRRSRKSHKLSVPTQTPLSSRQTRYLLRSADRQSAQARNQETRARLISRVKKDKICEETVKVRQNLKIYGRDGSIKALGSASGKINHQFSRERSENVAADKHDRNKSVANPDREKEKELRKLTIQPRDEYKKMLAKKSCTLQSNQHQATRRSPRNYDRPKSVRADNTGYPRQESKADNTGCTKAVSGFKAMRSVPRPKPPQKKARHCAETPSARLRSITVPGSSAKRRLIASPQTGTLGLMIRDKHKTINVIGGFSKQDKMKREKEPDKRDSIAKRMSHHTETNHRSDKYSLSETKAVSKIKHPMQKPGSEDEKKRKVHSKKVLDESHTSVMSIGAFGCLFGEE